MYGLVLIDETFENMIEKRAQYIAEMIVMRTSHSMDLEGQKNSPEQLKKAIEEKADEMNRTMPKYLWD